MWLVCITFTIVAIFLLALPCFKKISEEDKGWVSCLVYFISTLILIKCITNHSDFITDTIKAYNTGKIVKCETITVEEEDTIRVVKYKYK